MKRRVKFIFFCLVILLIFTVVMAYDNNKNVSNNSVSSEDILNKLSNQQGSQVKISNTDIQGIIDSSLISYNNSKFSFSGSSVTINPDNKGIIKIYLKDSVVGFPTSVSFNFNFTYVNNYMNISITKASIGKIPVPLSILRSFVKKNISKLENISSAIKDIDTSNLTVKLDLNSLIAQNQNIFTINKISSESNNIIFDLSINITDNISKLTSALNLLDDTSKQKVLSYLESNVSIDKKIQILKSYNIEIDKSNLEQFINTLK